MSEYNVTRTEKLLSSVASGNPSGIDPITREEMFLSYIAGESDTKPKPITRKEKLLDKIGVSGGGGGAKPEQEKTVNITENGTTEVIPDEGNTLSKVTVNTSVAAGGEPGKPYIDTSKMRSFVNFISKNPLLIDDINKLDTSKGEDFSSFCASVEIEALPQLDFGNATSLEYAFYNCKWLRTVDYINTINCVTFSNAFMECNSLVQMQIDIPSLLYSNNMFNNCKSLEKLVLLGIPKSDFSTNVFTGCTALKNLTIGEGWAVSIYLHYSNNLTVESLHGMIEKLADLTGQTAKTFQIGATNLAKIDEDHIAMLESKNWNFS